MHAARRLAAARDFDLSLRGGLGERTYRFRDAWIPLDDPDTDSVEYVQATDLDRLGLEAGLEVRVRLSRFATCTSDLLVFDGFRDLGRFDAAIIGWENDLSLSLTRAISLHYRVDLELIQELTPVPQLNHGAFIQASWNLL